MESDSNPNSLINANIMTNRSMESNQLAPRFKKVYEAFDSEGNLKWSEETHNLVTNQGKNDILDKYFKGSSYTAAWFLGLKGTGTIAAGDTLASHGGWTEITGYTGDRKAITWGTAASQALSADSTVTFAINATATIAGGFITTAETGTSGILYSVEDFSTSRSLVSGDTLNVTTIEVSMS
jgi:hypothetical protein